MTTAQKYTEQAIEFLYGPDDREKMDEIRSGLEAIFLAYGVEVRMALAKAAGPYGS